VKEDLRHLDVEHAVDAVRELLIDIANMVHDVSVEAHGNVMGDLRRKDIQFPTRDHELQVRLEPEIFLDYVSEDFLRKLYEPAMVSSVMVAHRDHAAHVGARR
jgi:hypothetical protein